nr:reverse transcriptase domain-containing protein [Tanacetum cinerariifolium]
MEIEEEEPKEEPGADVELEAEEPDGVPKAVIRAGSQRPFAIRDFPIGFHKTGESSTARNPQFIGGLAPWALRRDLEALRRHERIREAESETGRTELGRNGQGGNNHGGVYQLGAVNVLEDPKVVTGTFLLNNHYDTVLFDSGMDRSFISTKFSTLINIKPVEIDTLI